MRSRDAASEHGKKRVSFFAVGEGRSVTPRGCRGCVHDELRAAVVGTGAMGRGLREPRVEAPLPAPPRARQREGRQCSPQPGPSSRDSADRPAPCGRSVQAPSRAHGYGRSRSLRWAFSSSLAPFEVVNRASASTCVAEVEGEIVRILAAAPVFARRGWLVENLLRMRPRRRTAPPSCSSTAWDARRTSPLSTERARRWASRRSRVRVPRHPCQVRAQDVDAGLYDFHGLHAFRVEAATRRARGSQSTWRRRQGGSSP